MAFPPLRSDLNLYPSSNLASGAPAYTLHDSVKNQFFQLGWLEFEIIKRWSFSNIEKITQSIKHETTLTPVGQDVEKIALFLSQNDLLDVSGAEVTQDLLTKKRMQKSKPLTFLVKNYLFMRVPLVNPDQFLNKILPIFAPFFKIFYLKIILVLAALGAFLIFRSWPDFVSGFNILQTPQGIIIGILVLVFAKIIHELGHALACKYYGVRVPAVGLALIVLMPLLWTDTTEAWKLKNPKSRLMIDASGMIAELSLAAIASLLWVLLPEGNSKTAMHLLASTSWIMTLVVNLNPFMRFDGYYLLSDIMNTPNLQNRSFAVAKIKLRNFLFGLDKPVPESLNDFTQKWFTIYAIGTWIYRFFLFLGIALLVYHFFFKALGVLLFIIELWWFIGKPVVNEIKQWKEGVKNMKGAIRKTFYVGSISLLFIFFIIPLPHTIKAPAILKANQETLLVVPQASQLKKIHVTEGEIVKRGETLFSFESAELEKNISAVQIDLKTLQKEFLQNSLSSTYYNKSNLQNEDIKRLKSELLRLKSEKTALNITAPYDGIVHDIPFNLKENDWSQKRDAIGYLVSSKVVLEAFVEETDIEKLITQSKVKFYSHSMKNKLNGEVQSIQTSSVDILPYEELAHLYGGDIAVKPNIGKEGLKPEKKLYKVSIALKEPIEINNTVIGTAVIRGRSSSFLFDIFKKAYSLILRESGF
jgi:putative peptide zinc metalloprotease protein